jgi:hypothetical protein
MAGTMPHAIFMEPDVDGPGTFAAYAAEFPGCAVFGDSDDAAAAQMPSRVAAFGAWLRQRGEAAPTVIGDNWYEVERAAARPGDDGAVLRAAFSLDELSPSDAEFAQWTRWLELAREEVADALDAAGSIAPDAEAACRAIATRDLAMAAELGAADRGSADGDPIDALYAARDLLTDALEQAGPAHDGVRRVLRLAIADDLRLADTLRGGGG